MSYSVKMIVQLIQVGSNLYMNPSQIVTIKATSAPECKTAITTTNNYSHTCTDWPLDAVKEAIEKASK